MVEVSTLALAAMAGRRVALDSCQAFGAPVAEVDKQEGPGACTEARAIQAARRTWEPGASRDHSKVAASSIKDQHLAYPVVQ